jgi:hypothetical protein
MESMPERSRAYFACPSLHDQSTFPEGWSSRYVSATTRAAGRRSWDLPYTTSSASPLCGGEIPSSCAMRGAEAPIAPPARTMSD